MLLVKLLIYNTRLLLSTFRFFFFIDKKTLFLIDSYLSIEFNATTVRSTKMLTNKIKEESLRTYLFTYVTLYDVISMAKLADIFQLPVKQVYSIVSEMIISEELMVFCYSLLNKYRFIACSSAGFA